MVYLALAAGGVGSRMGKNLPKQFLDIGQQPVIIRTVKAFVDLVDHIYIGVLPEWKEYTEKLIESFELQKKVTVSLGGKSRMETIYKIIENIEAEGSVSEDDIILTHDAVRPFVNNRIILENIEKCREYSCCTTAVKCVDTIGFSKNEGIITSVPDRNEMYNIQTPQTVKFSLLKKIFSNINHYEKYTDLCGLLSSYGENIAIVEGEYTNIKITSPSDIIIAEGIVKE